MRILFDRQLFAADDFHHARTGTNNLRPKAVCGQLLSQTKRVRARSAERKRIGEQQDERGFGGHQDDTIATVAVRSRMISRSFDLWLSVGNIYPTHKILKVHQVQGRSLDETSSSFGSLLCPKHCRIWNLSPNGARTLCCRRFPLRQSQSTRRPRSLLPRMLLLRKRRRRVILSRRSRRDPRPSCDRRPRLREHESQHHHPE